MFMARLSHSPPSVNTVELAAFKRQAIIALAQRGWSQTDLARAIGKGRTSVNLALNKGGWPGVTRRIRQELSL